MRRRTFIRATTAASAALLAPRALRAARPRAVSFVLRGGLVYDGTGAPPVEVDVAVTADRITAVGRALRTGGATEVRLDGLALAPGFVDIHSHTDLVLLEHPRAESKVRQGVTTEVAGQDGSSVGPWSDATVARMHEERRERGRPELEFRDLGGFFRQLERQGMAPNLASMVGAGTIRGEVVGPDDRPASPAELARMVALVEEALAQGAVGLSTGLEYTPGAFASRDELVALAQPLSARGLPYASHLRNEDDAVLAAVEEATMIGRFAGVPVQLSHLKQQGQRNWWKIAPTLELIGAARESGTDVVFDVYPYVAYSTSLSNLFPVWTRDGGTQAFLARLRDADQRARIEPAVRDKVASLGSWDSVQITSTGAEELAWARGRRLGQLASERGQEPYELLLRLMLEDEGRPGMVGFGMGEENVERLIAHPLAIISSDGGARATTGPLSEGSPHPRAYGAFPRVLGHYVRERKLLPLEAAIHRMTDRPARRLRLEGRGRIAPGMFADLVAFDPARVADRATFERPHQYPEGIPHVWVNGVPVIRDGEHTGALPGRALGASSKAS